MLWGDDFHLNYNFQAAFYGAKRHGFLERVLHQNDHFTKTGSGQT
jgi:hypothetical protein